MSRGIGITDFAATGQSAVAQVKRHLARNKAGLLSLRLVLQRETHSVNLRSKVTMHTSLEWSVASSFRAFQSGERPTLERQLSNREETF